MYCIYREYGYFRRKDGRDIIEEFDRETLAVLSDEEFFQMSSEEDIEKLLESYKREYQYRDEESGEYSEVWIQRCDDCQ